MRKTAILGLAAAMLLAAAPGQALAGGPYMVGAYKCYNRKAYTTDYLRYVEGLDFRGCQALCDRTSGCVAFSYLVTALERWESTTICILHSRYDIPDTPWRHARAYVRANVCYRHHDVWNQLPREWRNRIGVEQDQLRPEFRPNVPSGPNKP